MVMNQKVGRDVHALERGEENGRPAVIRRARARIDGRMIRVAIRVGAFSGHGYNTDFDRGIRQPHLSDVIRGASGVSVSVVGEGVRIRFPSAVTFIADFPILEAQIVRDVGVTHPSRRFLCGAAAVIHHDECLRADVRCDANHFGKRR